MWVSVLALVILSAFLVIFVYYFSRSHGTFTRKLTMNHHEINMYRKCDDPHVRKLISDFKEKYPFSVDDLYNLPIDAFKKYVKATDELLDNIRRYLDQKKNRWPEFLAPFLFIDFFYKIDILCKAINHWEQ